MDNILHITSGDIVGESLAKSGIPGEVFVWHDIMYDGPRNPGWPDNNVLEFRAEFIEEATAGGLSKDRILSTLTNQYKKLTEALGYEQIVLWFDACLFDQSMLCHILTCMRFRGIQKVDLLCIDSFPGIVPYNGIGQLLPEQLISEYDKRKPVTPEQFDYAEIVDRAFALQDMKAFNELSNCDNAPIPWIPAAVTRWLQEQPDPETGLGRLEQLALDAIRAGCDTPIEIFKMVAANDTTPQYWGDTTLWAKINNLADHQPPLVRIEGPEPRLPQWEATSQLKHFKIII